MGIDQSKLGQHIQEMMQEIEDDQEIPEDAEIGRIITIVEVLTPDGEFSNIRMNSNARPYVALGFLEVAKEVQMRMMMGG
jgi:hypothetical protein